MSHKPIVQKVFSTCRETKFIMGKEKLAEKNKNNNNNKKQKNNRKASHSEVESLNNIGSFVTSPQIIMAYHFHRHFLHRGVKKFQFFFGFFYIKNHNCIKYTWNVAENHAKIICHILGSNRRCQSCQPSLIPLDHGRRYAESQILTYIYLLCVFYI